MAEHHDRAEHFARFFGTTTYLWWQTVIVVLWIILNVTAFVDHWDPYPFILLNLVFSTQASYAAPLILLASNRQEERDREQAADTHALTADVHRWLKDNPDFPTP